MRQRATRMSCTGNNYASRSDIYKAIFKDAANGARWQEDAAIKANKGAGIWGMASGWTPEQLALCMAFQDASGTIPVYAVEQPIGLLLDSRYAPGTRGESPLVGITPVNGTATFAVDSPDTTSYTDSNGYVYGAGGPFVIGHYYETSFTVSNYVKGAVTVSPGYGNAGTIAASNGTYIHRVFAGGDGVFYEQLSGGFTGTVKVNSIREIPGIHLTQYNTMERPTNGADLLQSIFDGTDDNQIAASGGGATTGFFFCAGIQIGKITGIQRLFDDRNATGGFCARISDAKFGLTTPSTPGYVAETGSVLVAGQKAVLTAWQTGSTLNVQINNGTVASVACPAVLPGTAQITFGKTNNAASDYFQGGIFERVYRTGVPLTDAEREAVKRKVALAAGVTL